MIRILYIFIRLLNKNSRLKRNIDWRALINLWSVLDYLTKYATKAGQGSKAVNEVFKNVLDNVEKHEEEDGLHDIWRRTIMKFYSQILGDREYSLFEVVHAGLGLPATLTNFGQVFHASVSDYVSLKKNVGPM